MAGSKGMTHYSFERSASGGAPAADKFSLADFYLQQDADFICVLLWLIILSCKALPSKSNRQTSPTLIHPQALVGW